MSKYREIFLFFSLILIFSGCSEIKNSTNMEELNKNIEYSIKAGVIGNDYPIDRALVSKMLSLANYTKNEILALDRVINFDDVNKENWYDKYINAVYIKGDMSGVLKNEFKPECGLTLTQTQYLIDKYDKEGKMKIKIEQKNKDKPISYALWCEIYSKMIEDKDIKEEDLIILATKDNSKQLKEDYAVTDKGIFSFEGLNPSLYVNKKIKVLKKDIEIIAIKEVLELEPTLKRCFIKDVKNRYINVFIGGVMQSIYFENIDMDKSKKNTFADIKIKDSNIISIEYYKDVIRGNVNKISDKNIRINNTNYVLDDDFKVYSYIEESIHFKDKKDLIIGQDMATYLTKGNENKIYGAIIDREPIINNVRIGINTNDFKGLYFDEIELYSDAGIYVMVKGKEKEFDKDSILKIKNDQDFEIGDNEIIIIQSLDEEKGIKFKNLKRGYEEPTFYGKIEICKINDKYVVINEVDLQRYLEGVLASNNYEYEDDEMLKVLSILYRTTAMSLISENNFYNYGANLDDSTKSQLYNNFKATKQHKRAIEDTEGKVILSNGEYIKGIYFGYSGGTTSNSGEIWADKNFYEYPSDNKPYLKHRKDFSEGFYECIKDEVNANIFFKTKDIDSIEKDSPWFRWSVIVEKEGINNINLKLEDLYIKYKNFIKVLENGQYVYKPIKTIGKVKDIKINKRGEGGNVMEIEIIGEENNIIIMTDSLIKEILKPDFIINNDGEKIKNMKVLPSSYFVFDKIYDNDGYLKKISFYGGGYGHGVGLSLYGADKLSKLGKTHEEILLYYYTDIKFENIN